MSPRINLIRQTKAAEVSGHNVSFYFEKNIKLPVESRIARSSLYVLTHVQSVRLAEESRETAVEWKENATPIRPYETASNS